MKRFMNNFHSCRLLTPYHVKRGSPASRPDSVGVNFTIRDPRSAIAFTLIEVMIAVAVVTMGIVAVLGLIPVGLKSARDAADNTLSATIAQDVFSVIRAQPFNNSVSGGHDLNTYTSPPGSPDLLYFDQSGTNMVAVATPYYSYYRVEINYTSLNIPPNPLRLSRIQATVVWPAWTGSPPINTNIFMTEVAWYDSSP